MADTVRPEKLVDLIRSYSVLELSLDDRLLRLHQEWTRGEMAAARATLKLIALDLDSQIELEAKAEYERDRKIPTDPGRN